MTPLQPTTTQQDLDALERIGKIIGSIAIISGAVAALIKWLRVRREKREIRYAARIERIVRAAFSIELASMTNAVRSLDRIEHSVIDNTTAIADIQKETLRLMTGGDEMLGLIVDAVRENREWLDDLQSLVDHSFQIDRRSSIGSDRRQRLTERLDALEERRTERRRAADRVREDLDMTRDRIKDISERGEVT